MKSAFLAFILICACDLAQAVSKEIKLQKVWSVQLDSQVDDFGYPQNVNTFASGDYSFQVSTYQSGQLRTKLLGAPTGILFATTSADNSKMFIIDAYRAYRVIDLTNFNEIAKGELKDEFYAAAWLPDNTVVVAFTQHNPGVVPLLAIIDPITQKVLREIRSDKVNPTSHVGKLSTFSNGRYISLRYYEREAGPFGVAYAVFDLSQQRHENALTFLGKHYVGSPTMFGIGKFENALNDESFLTVQSGNTHKNQNSNYSNYAWETFYPLYIESRDGRVLRNGSCSVYWNDNGQTLNSEYCFDIEQLAYSTSFKAWVMVGKGQVLISDLERKNIVALGTFPYFESGYDRRGRVVLSEDGKSLGFTTQKAGKLYYEVYQLSIK